MAENVNIDIVHDDAHTHVGLCLHDKTPRPLHSADCRPESRPEKSPNAQPDSPVDDDSEPLHDSQGSFSSGAGGDDTAPKLPSLASLWQERHLSQLNIAFRERDWRYIMKHVANFDFSIRDWSSIASVFQHLMENVPLDLEESTSSRLTKILTTPKKKSGVPIQQEESLMSGWEDERLLIKVLAKIRVAREKLKTDVTAKKMINRAGTKIKVHSFIDNVVVFLDQIIITLNKFCNGIAPTEAAFQHLFTLFARIFMLSFSPGNMSPVMEMEIFGQKVTCQPDLQYEHDCDDPGSGQPSRVLLVSVAEVKKFAPKKKECFTGPKIREDKGDVTYATTSTSTDSPPLPKRLKTGYNKDDDIDFPSSVRGQHAAELLFDVPNTVLEVPGRKKCVLGLVVQGTKVRLTCLEIKEDHMNQLLELKFRPLKEDRNAFVYYSRAWDMFVKADWGELVEMMITLGSIGDASERPLDNALQSYLPSSD